MSTRTRQRRVPAAPLATSQPPPAVSRGVAPVAYVLAALAVVGAAIGLLAGGGPGR
jgi:hypothetical protein